MKLIKTAGATSEIWQVFIRDSSSTTGAGLTGLAFGTASLTAYYHRDTDTTATAITLVTMTVGTFTSSGFKEIDATNMPGWYQFCPPNAALASGAKSCGFHLKGATNMAPLPIECQLSAVDPDSATAFITAVNGVAQTGDSYAIVNSGTFGNSALKTLIDTLDDFVDTEVAAIKLKTDLIPGTTSGLTLTQAVKVMLAVLAGKLSGAGTTTVTIRSADDATDVIVATVDADGNRSAVTINA